MTQSPPLWLALVLAAAGTAAVGAGAAFAQAAVEPAPSLLPPGVFVAPRTEVPWVVAVFALPVDGPPPEAWLLSALLEEPDIWRGSDVGALLDGGGRLEIKSGPEGILVVAEGPSSQEAQVYRAAFALLSGSLDERKPDGATLGRAQARALRRRALDGGDSGRLARDALWRAWFGPHTPGRALVLNEMQVIRADLSALEALRTGLARAPDPALFIEGRFTQASLAEAASRLAARTAPPLMARAVVPGPSRISLRHKGAPPRLLLAHPLPPSPELDGPFGAALLEAIRPAVGPLGASVELSHQRGATLLIFDVPLGERTADEVEAALKAALEGLRREPPLSKALAPLLARARAEEASRRAEIGGAALGRARRYLRFGSAGGDEGTPEALRERLRWVLLPEALRSVWVDSAAVPGEGDAPPQKVPPSSEAEPTPAGDRGAL